jgi:hypothetical protein
MVVRREHRSNSRSNNLVIVGHQNSNLALHHYIPKLGETVANAIKNTKVGKKFPAHWLLPSFSFSRESRQYPSPGT